MIRGGTGWRNEANHILAQSSNWLLVTVNWTSTMLSGIPNRRLVYSVRVAKSTYI